MEKMPAGIKGAWVENKRAVGSRYEAEAAVFLEKLGYKILEQNYRDRLGEIDIVAREGAYLVFVEVKYRKDGRCGHPEEEVAGRKQQRIRHTARYYLYSHQYGEDTACRFDVVSIDGDRIRVVRDAF